MFVVRDAFEELKQFKDFDQTYEQARKEMDNLWKLDSGTRLDDDIDNVLGFLKQNYHDGKIVKTGDASLAHKLEAQGYDWIKEEVVS